MVIPPYVTRKSHRGERDFVVKGKVWMASVETCTHHLAQAVSKTTLALTFLFNIWLCPGKVDTMT